jgi:hypothetical protein
MQAQTLNGSTAEATMNTIVDGYTFKLSEVLDA